MKHTVAVAGASGKVGSVVAEKLLENNISVRAIARNKDKLEKLRAKGADIFSGNFEDASFLADVFKGCKAAFVMLPPCYHLSGFREVLYQMASCLYDAIRKTNISHVVMLSSVGADLPSGNGQISSLYELESMLKSINELSVIAIRPAFYMDNHLGSIPLIKNSGINGSIFDPDNRIGMISTKDIGTAAAEYLIEPGFSGFNVRYLLGPKDYSFREATSILGSAIGKPDLHYVKFSYEDFNKGLISAGFSSSAADALYEGLTALNEGRLTNNVTRNSSNTTATTLEDFSKDVFAKVYANF